MRVVKLHLIYVWKTHYTQAIITNVNFGANPFSQYFAICFVSWVQILSRNILFVSDVV